MAITIDQDFKEKVELIGKYKSKNAEWEKIYKYGVNINSPKLSNTDRAKVVSNVNKLYEGLKKAEESKATKKTASPKSGVKKKTMLGLASEIMKRDNITWNEAKAKAKQEFESNRKKAISEENQKISDFEKQVGKIKFVRATTKTDIKKDKVLPALPSGKRYPKRGTTTNKFGTFKNDPKKPYWENRANRMDVNQPSKSVYPKLANGGQFESLKVGSKVGFLRPQTGRYEYAEVLSIDGNNVNLVVRHPKRSQWDNYFSETKERISKFLNTPSEDWKDGRPVLKIKYAEGGEVTIPIQVIVDGNWDEPKFFKTIRLAKKYIVENTKNHDFELVDSYGDSIYIEKGSSKADFDFLFSDLSYAKGGKFNDNLYVDQLAGMSGARAVAVKEWASDNNLSKDDLLNIIQGLGRKQITSADFVSAVLGDKSATSEIISYAKSGKGFKMADGGVIGSGKNGYIAFYKGKRIEVYADTMYGAQQTAAKYFKAKKEYEVNVSLAEVDGNPYIQSAAFAKGGMTEHGLQVGDKIVMDVQKRVGNMPNTIGVEDYDKEFHLVDLDKGERYAKGGQTKAFPFAVELLVKKSYGNDGGIIANFKGKGDAMICARALNENSPENYEYSVKELKKYAQGGEVGQKVFEAKEDGILGIFSGSDAYSIQISKGDTFVTYGDQDNSNWWYVKKIDKKPSAMSLNNNFDYTKSKSRVKVNWDDLILTFPKGDNMIYAKMQEIHAQGGTTKRIKRMGC